MTSRTDGILLRRAIASDAFSISDLYDRVYEGAYSDPMMASPEDIRRALTMDEYHWFVAVPKHDPAGRVVASVVYRYDAHNALAKVFGAVVEERFRGEHLTEDLMKMGHEELRKQSPPVEVIYSLARTVSSAPQKITAKLGYRRLGLFPNVHKTDLYETHALAALFSEKALEARHAHFELHPKLAGIFKIAQQECDLPSLKIAKIVSTPPKRSRSDLHLEVINAPQFVQHRFDAELKKGYGQSWFFPFHAANLLLTSPDQDTEVFCYLSHRDQHCVLIGIRDAKKRGLSPILEATTLTLRDMGVRYIELILRAQDLDKVEAVLQSEFIPCAYFPAMYLEGKSRFDFVACSRSFETLNFRNIQLEGVNKKYLLQYFKLWKEVSLGDEES